MHGEYNVKKEERQWINEHKSQTEAYLGFRNYYNYLDVLSFVSANDNYEVKYKW